MRLLMACWYELKLAVLRALRYKVNFVSDIVVFTLLFFGVMFLNTNSNLGDFYGASDAQTKILVLIGYAFWMFSSTSLGVSSGVISDEASAGTLETKMLCAVPVTALLLMRLLSGLLHAVLSMLAVLIAAYVMGWFHYSHIVRFLLAFCIYFPSILGMFGAGLILGGITLRHKRIGQLTFIVQIAMLMLTDVLSIGFESAKYIVPYSMGMDIARNFYMANPVLTSDVLIYLSINVIWFITGCILFNAFLINAKKKGTLGNY